jgi:hypothetical protein
MVVASTTIVPVGAGSASVDFDGFEFDVTVELVAAACVVDGVAAEVLAGAVDVEPATGAVAGDVAFDAWLPQETSASTPRAMAAVRCEARGEIVRIMRCVLRGRTWRGTS